MREFEDHLTQQEQDLNMRAADLQKQRDELERQQAELNAQKVELQQVSKQTGIKTSIDSVVSEFSPLDVAKVYVFSSVFV